MNIFWTSVTNLHSNLKEMDTGTWDQNLDEVIWIPNNCNTFVIKYESNYPPN